MNLYEELKSYVPYNEQEAGDLKVMMKYLESFDDVYTRDNVFGHITASPWIINEDASKVLMIYHNIYDSWGWCGGHADGDQESDPCSFKGRNGRNRCNTAIFAGFAYSCD